MLKHSCSFQLVVTTLVVMLVESRALALHTIQVLDDQTNRGVPLVELTTTSSIKLVTDSNGIATFDEPGLMDRDVWFTIKSHGYEVKPDWLGSRGAHVNTKQGATTTLKIHRVNIAERIYRVTGQGIYGESIKAGLKAPIENPILNGDVMGQDSVQTIIYRDKLYWFWGDTNKVDYALGQFGTSGATSDLPSKGGLDPNVGVNLKYFVDKNGFSRPMVDMKEPGAKWIGGLMTVLDDKGQERLLCACTRVKDLGTRLERALMIYNNEKEIFERLKVLDKDEEIIPNGQPFVLPKSGLEDQIYFPIPYPSLRTEHTFKAVTDLHTYEAFTCLKKGTRYATEKSQLDRDASGKLIWDWKRDTGTIDEKQQEELIKAHLIKEDDRWFDLKDIETKKRVMAHGGSVEWNPYRKKWIMILVEWGGSSSLLGEVWFTESQSDMPEGPYRLARKIATHDKQTFYNPIHHPQFDQQAGRIIYFEGTYCNTFSGNPEETPRYNYNQVMYRLDLADERLKLK